MALIDKGLVPLHASSAAPIQETALFRASFASSSRAIALFYIYPEVNMGFSYLELVIECDKYGLMTPLLPPSLISCQAFLIMRTIVPPT